MVPIAILHVVALVSHCFTLSWCLLIVFVGGGLLVSIVPLCLGVCLVFLLGVCLVVARACFFLAVLGDVARCTLLGLGAGYNCLRVFLFCIVGVARFCVLCFLHVWSACLRYACAILFSSWWLIIFGRLGFFSSARLRGLRLPPSLSVVALFAAHRRPRGVS